MQEKCISRTCELCKAPFFSRKPNQRFCCEEHRREAIHGPRVRREPTPCANCQTLILPKNKNHKFCSPRCGNAKLVAQIRGMSLGSQLGLPTGTVGALNELRVAVDLMLKGYHVFRALSQASPCDLVAFRSGEAVLRVEVKTAYPLKQGITIPTIKNPEKKDILACVTPDGAVVYSPELPSQ